MALKNRSRATHLVVTAALAAASPNRAAVLSSVLNTPRNAKGHKKAQRIIQRLIPKLVSDMLVSADDHDRRSPADVIPLLQDFLLENWQMRHIVLFHLILAIIRHGGDDSGHLTRRLLLLDESNVTQAVGDNWGLQHLCCKYGRFKQLRVVLGLGLSPFTSVNIDGVPYEPLDVAKRFSPNIVDQFQTLIEFMPILRNLCRHHPAVFPLLRSAVGTKHFERDVIYLSAQAFERDGDVP
ncbi:hypothetical protein EDB81DRAFT_766614 [Dactylonectria macrodidyma]|uniref:Uncharacterized protein n=1 Tax=Dactylonectria macrodidyma TaxID=307937 RepID=A0A9P9IIA3_9HYPO|nr:hypothetical protein EDB81DRAFT_766614 [Dactylonectria macrodidyma]